MRIFVCSVCIALFLITKTPVFAWGTEIVDLEQQNASDKLPTELVCTTAEVNVEMLKQNLRSFRGFSSFHGWRLREVNPVGCALNGRLQVDISLSPPDSWKGLTLPYRLNLLLWMDPVTLNPLEPLPSDLKQLAKNTKDLVDRVEILPDVAHFVDRFKPSSAILKTSSASELVTLKLNGTKGASDERLATLIVASDHETGIVSYELPRLDSLPLRRELLKFAELLSQKHSHCQARTIEALWHRAQLSSEVPAHWQIRAVLSGTNCPNQFVGYISQTGEAVESKEALSEPNTAVKNR